MPYDSDDYENDSVDWWDDVNVSHEDESFDEWRRKNNPMVDHLEELRPLMNLKDPADAALVFLHHFLGISFRALEACESLHKFPKSKSAFEERFKQIRRNLAAQCEKELPKRVRRKRIPRVPTPKDRMLKCGFVCPECKRSVLAYQQPENCSEHDNE